MHLYSYLISGFYWSMWESFSDYFFYVFGAVGKFDLVLEFQILKSRKYNNVN